MEVGGFILGAGITSADFQMQGMYPSRTEALKIAATGSHIKGAKSFSSQFGSPSGPGALWILMRDS